MTMLPNNLLECVEIFHGEATPAVARLYVRLDTDNSQSGWSLAGQVKGPYRTDAHTLPATTPLVPCATGESLLAMAVIPDPCAWTPETPSMYQLDLQLHVPQERVMERQIVTGIRGLGARGPNLFRHGKRWVVRALESPTGEITNWTAWQSNASMMVVDPVTETLVTEAFLSQASKMGVPLVVKLPPSLQEMESLLCAISHWPAVSVVYVDTGSPMIVEPQRRFPNLLFAERFCGNQKILPAPWAQLVLCDVQSVEEFSMAISDCRETSPIVAVREIVQETSFEGVRSECDQLQRDLAGVLDCAGYLVLKQG